MCCFVLLFFFPKISISVSLSFVATLLVPALDTRSVPRCSLTVSIASPSSTWATAFGCVVWVASRTAAFVVNSTGRTCLCLCLCLCLRSSVWSRVCCNGHGLSFTDVLWNTYELLEENRKENFKSHLRATFDQHHAKMLSSTDATTN